ncbi:MAG: hypothetical protein ABW078_06285 [Sedimenticola sp.]
MEGNRCVIWGTKASIDYRNQDDCWLIDSPRAGGLYQISEQVACGLRSLTPLERAKLTTWLMNRRYEGEHDPIVTQSIIEYSVNARPLKEKAKIIRLLNYIDKMYNTDYLSEGLSEIKQECQMQMMACTESVLINEIFNKIKKLKHKKLIDENLTVSEQGVLYLRKSYGYINEETDLSAVLM